MCWGPEGKQLSGCGGYTQKESASLMGCPWLCEVSLLAHRAVGMGEITQKKGQRGEIGKESEGCEQSNGYRQPAVDPGRRGEKRKRKKTSCSTVWAQMR